MEIDVGTWEMAVRLLLAVALGATVGWERERKHKPAGLKTHAMVALGAAAFTLLSLHFIQLAAPLEGTRADPLRLVAGLIGGIGFLGGGAIIQGRGSVEGITTAATIWMSGALGLAAGAGQYVLSAMTVVLAFLILKAMAAIESRLSGLYRDAGVAHDGADPPSDAPP